VDFPDYVRLLRRGWPVVLAFIVIGIAGGVALTLATPKVYKAGVQLFVATTSGTSGASQLASGNSFVQSQVQSYTSIATSPAVTGPVVRQLRLGRFGITAQDLAGKISSSAPVNTVLVDINVTDHDPTRAAAVANAVARQFSLVVERTEQTQANATPVVKLTVIHPASVPSRPIKPVPLLNIGLGFVLGLLAGVLVVLLRNTLDNTVKAPSDFDDLGLSVLGMVPLDRRAAKAPIALRRDPHGARAESYRQIRTNLQFLNVDNAPRVIAVTSAVPAEGKTTTAMNLAAVLAEAGYRVCLLEADLRRPTLASRLGLIPDVGLTTVLIGKVPLERALQNVGRNLAVLTSGPLPPNPSELLHAAQTRTVIRTIADHVDYTIIDTSPLLPVADAAEIAALADATLVVHRAGKTTRDQAARSVEVLDRIGERPVGVILNMVTRSNGRPDDEYGNYYASRPKKDRHGDREPEPDGVVPNAAGSFKTANGHVAEPATDPAAGSGKATKG
jgi:non-specific protein-tyrosine kinase